MSRHVPTIAVVVLVTAFVVSAACGGGSPSATTTPATATTTPSSTRSPEATPMETNAFGVRYCEYVPGQSQPTAMPPEVLHPPIDTTAPTATLPAQASVSTETTQNQMRTFSALVDKVSQTYVYPDFNGHDWPALTARYKSLIEGGVNDEGFYQAMGQMIAELGDNHSYFQSPSDVAADDAANSQGQNFVGIGILANPVLGTGTGALIAVFPNSPAADAGLRPHDLLLEVDGQTAYDVQTAKSRTLGVEGSSFALKYQRPGGALQTVTLTRRAVSGFLPVGYCIVPNTRIGYILLPTFLDQSIADQVRTALQKMTQDGPLHGLVLDRSGAQRARRLGGLRWGLKPGTFTPGTPTSSEIRAVFVVRAFAPARAGSPAVAAAWEGASRARSGRFPRSRRALFLHSTNRVRFSEETGTGRRPCVTRAARSRPAPGRAVAPRTVPRGRAQHRAARSRRAPCHAVAPSTGPRGRAQHRAASRPTARPNRRRGSSNTGTTCASPLWQPRTATPLSH